MIIKSFIKSLVLKELVCNSRNPDPPASEEGRVGTAADDTVSADSGD